MEAQFVEIPVESIKNDYKISRAGDIFSVKTNKTLRQHISNGYYTVVLLVNNKTVTFAVSRLVALTFIPNPENKNVVNHMNGDKLDNRVENLEWTTQKENIQHALREKLWVPNKTRVQQFDLNNVLLKTFDSIDEAAKSINLTRHSIIKVCKGKNKTAGKFIWKYEDITKQQKIKIPEDAKKIDGYNYYVDNKGNVYSSGQKKILKPVKNMNGYHYVTLCKNRTKQNCYVHRLVAECFIDNPDKKPLVNHKNGTKTDNRVKNLEWVTNSENIKHSYNTLRL